MLLDLNTKIKTTMQPTQEQAQDIFLLDALTKAITGYGLADLSEDKRMETAEACYNLYQNQVQQYFEEHYSPKDVMKFKSLAKYEHPDLEEDADLKEKFQAANLAVFESLKIQ